MIRTFKAIFLTIMLAVIVSLLLPGCYTQLSRPRVVTTEEYIEPADSETTEEYYQDEGAPQPEDTRDVYIYNYYPPYGFDYYDYWYWSYYPYPWRYIGPDPYYWWNPYGQWWTPGWYIGIYHHDYWWQGYYSYYGSYYGDGYGGRPSNYTSRTFEKRPFDRRSMRGISRDERASDSQSSLAKPIGPARVERPQSTLSKPEVPDQSIKPDRQDRPIKEMVNQRLRSKPSKNLDDGKSSTTSKERATSRPPRTVKTPPRSNETATKPKIIERTPAQSTPDAPKKNSTAPDRSSKKNSNSISRPSNSGNTHINRPSAPSYTPRSSNSNSGSRSTPPRSSSTPTRSSNSSSSSKSSGSSKNKR